MVRAGGGGLAAATLLLVALARAEQPNNNNNNNNNITYVPPHSSLPSIFSPRMDFEQWKPLTGRGDPLQNDPTYDYEPPKLDRVRYWLDPVTSKPEEKVKSEVLILGVSSKKPSVVKSSIKRDDIGINKYINSPKVPNYFHYFSHPNMPPRHRPTSHVSFPPTSQTKIKYEDYSYKVVDSHPIPMTILVPPPPPPPGKIHGTYYEIVEEEHMKTYTTTEPTVVFNTVQPFVATESAPATAPPLSVQESNLIFQSSTVHHDWDYNNGSSEFKEPNVSSDYAGWGPTSHPDLAESNYTHNLINSDSFSNKQNDQSFYRPPTSAAPPLLKLHTEAVSSTEKSLLTAKDKFESIPTGQMSSTVSRIVKPISTTPRPKPTETPTTTTTTMRTHTTPKIVRSSVKNPEISIKKHKENKVVFEPTPLPPLPKIPDNMAIFGMLAPMFGMPMSNRPDVSDNYLKHITEKPFFYRETTTQKQDWEKELEKMQTMQPPPVLVTTEAIPVHFDHNLPTRQPSPLKVTEAIDESLVQIPKKNYESISKTQLSTPTSIDNVLGKVETSSETNVPSSYLIIQGHSKVKTYGSKVKSSNDGKDIIDNEIPQSKTFQVKHLHQTGNKSTENQELKKDKVDRSKNRRSLKNLVSDGVGTIEIQEANLGIKYDVSDGTGVPAEIYKKGFVENEEINYTKRKTTPKPASRQKRQIAIISNIIPVSEQAVEQYIYDYLKRKSIENGITGLIASIVTSDAAEVIDDIEDETDDYDDDIIDDPLIGQRYIML